MNAADILVTLAVAGAVALAVALLRRNRKNGKTCCGDCSRCAGSCEKK